MKSRILFVDDEPRILDAFRRMLSGQNPDWETIFALSADEALEKTAETDFDAVVSDIAMPGKNGFDLLTMLRGSEKTKDVPVIIVTGDAEHSLKRRALDLGASDLLNKPVATDDLIARLQSVLRLKSYQDEIKAQNEILERRVRERTKELELSRLDIIARLAKAGEYRDEDTGNHVARVGWYCRIVAEALGRDADFTDLVFLASPLHDIGKIGIPDHILLKPGKLSFDEWDIMEQHCVIGAQILREDPKTLHLLDSDLMRRVREESANYENPFLEMASSIALHHHERWDGKGYPKGLKQTEIPLEARITALADIYDALGSKRPYKPAFPEDKVRSIMRNEAGKHFDPDVYAAFEETFEEIRSIRIQFSDENAFAESVKTAS